METFIDAGDAVIERLIAAGWDVPMQVAMIVDSITGRKGVVVLAESFFTNDQRRQLLIVKTFGGAVESVRKLFSTIECVKYPHGTPTDYTFVLNRAIND